jgi:(p)ppGpp synthase/HD superfamily hydrolase
MNTPNNQLQTAIEIATKAHADQTDKQGLPYILHPLAVMNGVVSLGLTPRKKLDLVQLRIVAVLHDVVEDTEWTLEELDKTIGFSKIVIDALELLTHTKELSYAEYIDRIKNSNNEYARLVKLADLYHNSSLPRASILNKNQLKKYADAYALLLRRE